MLNPQKNFVIMTIKIQKRDFVREIREHLQRLGIRHGERLELDETIVRQKINFGERVYFYETKAKSISISGVFFEFFADGVRLDYSGEYKFNDKNLTCGMAATLADLLRDKQ